MGYMHTVNGRTRMATLMDDTALEEAMMKKSPSDIAQVFLSSICIGAQLTRKRDRASLMMRFLEEGSCWC